MERDNTIGLYFGFLFEEEAVDTGEQPEPLHDKLEYFFIVMCSLML